MEVDFSKYTFTRLDKTLCICRAKPFMLIDLETGEQPIITMCNNCGRIWVRHKGESVIANPGDDRLECKKADKQAKERK